MRIDADRRTVDLAMRDAKAMRERGFLWGEVADNLNREYPGLSFDARAQILRRCFEEEDNARAATSLRP